MTPLVLVHGGGVDRRSWDLVVPELSAPVLAVDLPGRGRHPQPLSEVTFASCARSVADDVAQAGFADLVLVGHSLAGCSMPAIVAALGDRVRHAVFVACTVPEDGTSSLDTLDPVVREQLTAERPAGASRGVFRQTIGDTLDEAQLAWCAERFVPEAPRLATDPVDLAPLRAGAFRRTWVRTRRDAIVPPDRQLRFAANVGDCEVVDLDTSHLCMVTAPRELARLLDGFAAIG